MGTTLKHMALAKSRGSHTTKKKMENTREMAQLVRQAQELHSEGMVTHG